ncbi:MAG TPA: hypothetical protein VMV86_04650, partial [Methanosarcinales archaeon]|nr:hypothetical protein [Methanosarcinales archaeon]
MKNEKVDINEIVKYLYSDSAHKILIEQLIDAGIIFSVYGSTLRAGVEVATRGDTATTPRDLDVFIGVSTLDHVPGRIVDIEKEFKLGGYVFNYVAKYPSYIKDEKGSADKFETYEYTVNGKLIHLVFGTTLPTNVETLDADVNCLYLCKVGCTPGWTLRSSAGYDLDKVVENIKNKTFILGKTSFSSRTKKLLEAGYKQLVKVDLPEDVVDEIVQISRTYSYNFTPISNPLTEEALVKFKEEYKEFASIEPSAISFRSAPFLKKMSGQIHWGNVSLPGDMFAELWNYPQDIGAAFFAHATSPATRTKFYSQLRDTLHKLKESAIDSIINSLNPCYFNDQEFLTIFLPQLSTQQLRALVGKPGFNI